MKTLASVRGAQRVTTQNPESTYQALEQYGRDLTQVEPGLVEADGGRERIVATGRWNEQK